MKSGGAEFDAAAVEAAEASRYLSPAQGGPALTVVEYTFPVPPEEEAPAEGAAAPEAPTPSVSPIPEDTAPVDSAAVTPPPAPVPGLRDRRLEQ